MRFAPIIILLILVFTGCSSKPTSEQIVGSWSATNYPAETIDFSADGMKVVFGSGEGKPMILGTYNFKDTRTLEITLKSFEGGDGHTIPMHSWMTIQLGNALLDGEEYTFTAQIETTDNSLQFKPAGSDEAIEYARVH